MALLCRVCGKEQQPHHTGNWRNHQYSHCARKSLDCEMCGKVTKNKHDLKKHMKEEHADEPEEQQSSLELNHPCQICGRTFKRRMDVKKHIAESHNIDPENLCEPTEEGSLCENNSLSTTAEPLLVNVTSLIKSQSSSKKTDLKSSSQAPRKAKTAYTAKMTLEEKPTGKPMDIQLTPLIKSTLKSSKTSSSSGTSKSSRSSNRTLNRTFTCGVCNENFRTKNDLKNHKRVVHFLGQDDQDATYVCNKCRKSFHKHIDLTNHTIENHGIDEAIIPTPTTPSVATVQPPPKGGGKTPPRVEMEERPSTSPTMAELNRKRTGSLCEETDELVIVIKEENISDSEEMCIDFPVVDAEEKPSEI